MRSLRTRSSRRDVLAAASAAGPVRAGPSIRNSSLAIGVMPLSPLLPPPKHINPPSKVCPAMRGHLTFSTPSTCTFAWRHFSVTRSNTARSDSQCEPRAGHPPCTSMSRPLPPSTVYPVRCRPMGAGCRAASSARNSACVPYPSPGPLGGGGANLQVQVSTHNTHGSIDAVSRVMLSSYPPMITISSPRRRRCPLRLVPGGVPRVPGEVLTGPTVSGVPRVPGGAALGTFPTVPTVPGVLPRPR
mmetsp:Transcript_36886/g.91135  ORF Transcript_36886/g.91135 Transcript_36886/m.91135 type:complete len:244 (-) Transcript_36886:938-1669(-)